MEDHGQSQLAEFIRVQLALANLAEADGPRRQELQGRERTLLQEHEHEWCRQLPRVVAGRTFAPEQHARLQANVPLLNHLSGVIQALHAARVEDLRRAVTAWFALDVDDVYLPGEPVSVRLHALSNLDPGTLPEVKATISVLSKESGQEVVRREVALARERTEFVLGEPGPGTYLLTVSGLGATAPVSDVFAVASAEELAS